ncbi:hypothetical protein F7725_006429 [Dissostichus mawsoni]|uniref:Uncharacterized protein n=1 Tax=Dissostichus mawsoni TaxID=36200 RepID=A0A7J5XVJ3_DISMA|nr:hypothetical protein F7725_006429 [Dissostichus mawsoni]
MMTPPLCQCLTPAVSLCDQEVSSPRPPMSTRCFASPSLSSRTSLSWSLRWTWWTPAAASP